MKFVDDFESFLKTEVNLDQGRLDKLQQRVDLVEDFVAGHETLGPMFLDLIPAGSWAHRTIIKPVDANDEFDGDVLLYVTEQVGLVPKDYIERVYAAFRGNGKYKQLAKRKTRCVRIDYAGDFHIDVVPYLDRAAAHYITNRSEPESVGRFELSNPEGFTAWIDERQRLTNSTFIKVVRLVKYLRDFKNTFGCKSIILTTLLGDQVNPIDASFYPAKFADVPSTLVTVMTRLAESLPVTMPVVMDPAGTGNNFTDRYKDSWNYDNFRKWIVYYAEKMREALDETDDRAASIDAWRAIFGDAFKPGYLAKAAALEPLSASVPWAGEQFIDRPPLNFPIRLEPKYSAHVTGRVTGLHVGHVSRKNGFRQYELAKHGNRVKKNRNVQFTVATNVPAPDGIYWKVRNGGAEAASVKELRGEITPTSGLVRNETTSYTGRHYVECYIVKGGVVVASDRQDVVVTLR
jgi:hypothetical protein